VLSLTIPSEIPSGADDAALLADVAAIRAGIIASKVFCIAEDTRCPAESLFWDDMLALMAPLPPDTVIIRTVLDDADPPVSAPVLTQRAHSRADSPMTDAPEQRTVGPLEPEQFDSLMLERVVRMGKRRQLRVHHSGPSIRLTSPDGETRYDGTVAQVYEALKRDVVTKLPPTPQQELRDRLAGAAAWGVWSLVEDHDGRFTLVRNDERMFSGSLEEMQMVAASRILNTTPNYGYSLGHPE
jgi:hypothetical protein